MTFSSEEDSTATEPAIEESEEENKLLSQAIEKEIDIVLCSACGSKWKTKQDTLKKNSNFLCGYCAAEEIVKMKKTIQDKDERI